MEGRMDRPIEASQKIPNPVLGNMDEAISIAWGLQPFKRVQSWCTT